MNILLIRNGFNLAHGLPTQYRGFLHFGQKVEKIFSVGSNVDVNMYDREELVDWEIDNTIKNTLKDNNRVDLSCNLVFNCINIAPKLRKHHLDHSWQCFLKSMRSHNLLCEILSSSKKHTHSGSPWLRKNV